MIGTFGRAKCPKIHYRSFSFKKHNPLIKNVVYILLQITLVSHILSTTAESYIPEVNDFLKIHF